MGTLNLRDLSKEILTQQYYSTLTIHKMKRFIVAAALLVLSACATDQNAHTSVTPSQTQGQLTIGGSAETLAILKPLSITYQEQTKGVEIEFLPPSQTSGGIQGVKDNLFDIGAVSRTIEPEEARELQFISLTQTPLVFITHESVTGVENLTSTQIQEIYQGKITNWQQVGGPDAAIILFDFTEDENEKIVLRQHYLGSDLEITPTAVVFGEDEELLNTAAITPYSLTAIPWNEELETLPVNVLTIDGVTPSQKTLANGAYNGSIHLGVVIGSQPSAITEDFLNFALSSEGQTILVGNKSAEVEN